MDFNNYTFDKKEWERKFLLSNLYLKWKEKGIINYYCKFKTFPNNCSFRDIPESKAFIIDLRDPDIIELKHKKWNISMQIIKLNLK